MNEAELLIQLQDGNRRAFEMLLREQQTRIVNVAYSLLHNREDAEEVAQDVFIEVYRSIANFRGDSKLSTWLYRIAVNKALNYRRRKRTSLIAYFEQMMLSGGLQIEDSSPLPDAKLVAEERTKILHKAIDALPEKQRIAFTLQKYEDLSQEEIAEVMQTTVSAVESHLYRAKRELQKTLSRIAKDM